MIDRFEVDLRYGNFLVRQTDLSLSDTFDVPLARTYNSGDYIQANRSRSYEMLVFEDGDDLFFDRISEGTSYADAVFQTHGEIHKVLWSCDGMEWRWQGHFPARWNKDGMRVS